jgi:hypothetical protein
MASTAIFMRYPFPFPPGSFFLFYFDDLPSFVSPAMGADVMRENGFMTLRA